MMNSIEYYRLGIRWYRHKARVCMICGKRSIADNLNCECINEERVDTHVGGTIPKDNEELRMLKGIW